MIPTKCTYWNHPLYLPQLFFESHLLCKCRQLCLEQDVQRALYACPLQRESRFPHCNIVGSLISSGKRFYRTLFSILWLGKVILGDSKANSFPSISYVCQEEVVVVTACFVTPKTHLGNVGVILFYNLQCVFNDWADCIPVLLARIKDIPKRIQLNPPKASILSYYRWYVPAKVSFSKPTGLLLTISHLKKFHGPVHYQDSWRVVGWSKCILFNLFLVYWTNNVGFPQQDVWIARIRAFSQTFSLYKWWFWRCQLISLSQLFRAIHSVNPRLLLHVPLVITEKEHDPAIANSKNDAKRKK